MKLLVSFIFLALSLPAMAESHKSMICTSGDYKITTYQSPVAQSEILVLVQKNEIGIYSNVYSFIYEALPVQAWILTGVQNNKNILAIVADSETTAVADISIDLEEEGFLKVHGAECQLNAFSQK